MNKVLSFLSRRRLTLRARIGLPVLAIGLVTLIRLVAPLDVAPFLVYLPILFLIGVALGRSAGLVATALSTALAAWFFLRANDGGPLTTGQIVALAQYILVGAGMVLVCDALRRAILENETTLARLNDTNRILIESQASLRLAKNEAETAREDAEAARDAAEGANRAKSAFLANMSHELRTPLSAVIGYSEMLEEEAEELGHGSMLTDLGKIKSNAKHLLSLINDVLDLSKVEANKMDTFAEDLDVAAFARETAATVDALVRRKGNTLVLELGQDLGTMHSDSVKLRQCLFNLLSNAAKFTEGGHITLQVTRDAAAGDWLEFAVRDTGIGMSPEQLARLFERFTQADETTTRKFGGTGLGLALSRAFARLLGGDIAVTSAEGNGTCFTLRVPTVLPEFQAEAETAPSAADAGDGTGDLVLVIDDEASQRELMTRFLQRQNFAVRTAEDGRSGLALARSLKPRVILLDVMMPDMDGWSVLGALKGDPEVSKIPVVMVSFVAESGISAAMGAADAVPKPVDWARLKTVMDGFRDAGGDVLVVDDDPDIRQRLRTVLEKNRWTVQEAGDGAEALQRVMHAPPHLILLDLTMPVMDGFSFLHRLRETPGCADIPVVVLSARDISAAEREQLSEADRVLRKGETSMKELTATIRTLEGLHEARGQPAPVDPPM